MTNRYKVSQRKTRERRQEENLVQRARDRKSIEEKERAERARDQVERFRTSTRPGELSEAPPGKTRWGEITGEGLCGDLPNVREFLVTFGDRVEELAKDQEEAEATDKMPFHLNVAARIQDDGRSMLRVVKPNEWPTEFEIAVIEEGAHELGLIARRGRWLARRRGITDDGLYPVDLVQLEDTERVLVPPGIFLLGPFVDLKDQGAVTPEGASEETPDET